MKKTNTNAQAQESANVKVDTQDAIKLEDLPEEEELIIIDDTVENAENAEVTEEQQKPRRKKGLVKRVTGWCKRHKKALIFTGIAAGAAVGGYAYYKHYKRGVRRHQQALEAAITEGAPALVDKSIADLPMAEYAAAATDVDSSFLVDKVPDLKMIDRTGKTFLQNLPTFNGEYTKMSSKIVDSTKDEITKAVLESLDNVIDNVDIDTIKSVSLLYDIT